VSYNEIELKDYRTIVLSDIHLGSKWSKTKEATRFLKKNSCETLILCGDIIDGWAILRGKKAKWKRRHTNFIKAILDLAHHTRIVYVRGNHDDFLDRLIPIKFLGISIVRDWIESLSALTEDFSDHWAICRAAEQAVPVPAPEIAVDRRAHVPGTIMSNEIPAA
jgi:metallophosphoesterase superfamily enzyme